MMARATRLIAHCAKPLPRRMLTRCIIASAPGVTSTIQLAAALPSLNTNMAIQGPGANLLTVRRNIGGSYRLFNISGNNVTISGLTIANGNSPSNGGGISITGGLTIANCTISGNTTGSSGGGIVSSRTLSIVNSTVSGNSATGGFGGGIYNTGTAQITNTTISNNSVSEPSFGIGSGGGIQNGGGTGDCHQQHHLRQHRPVQGRGH